MCSPTSPATRIPSYESSAQQPKTGRCPVPRWRRRAGTGHRARSRASGRGDHGGPRGFGSAAGPTFEEVPAVVWHRHGLRTDGSVLPCRILPLPCRREVEVHHVDLGLGYQISDWPAEFVSADLPHALDRCLSGSDTPHNVQSSWPGFTAAPTGRRASLCGPSENCARLAGRFSRLDRLDQGSSPTPQTLFRPDKAGCRDVRSPARAPGTSPV